MLRLPHSVLALTCAALLFCTGCQFISNDPDHGWESATTITDVVVIVPDGTTNEPTTPSTTTLPVNTDPVFTTHPPVQTTTKVPSTSSATTTSKLPASTTSHTPITTPVNTPVTTPDHTPVTTPDGTTPATPETDEPTVPKKRVAFTFDDGPHATLTYKFVDKLKEYDATATFFVVGNRIGAKCGAAIAYAYENGCEIGIHSYTHKKALYYDRCTREEYFADMQKTANAINKYVPATVTLMRPPGGNITSDRIASCPYAVIHWSVDSNDWRYKSRTDAATIEANVNTIVNNVMKDIDDGDIVLMHEIYQNTYEAFCILIERLYADGYEIVSVSELLGDKLQPGVKYRQG